MHITVIDTCSPSKNEHNGYAIRFYSISLASHSRTQFLSISQYYFFIVLTFLFIYLHEMLLHAWFSLVWSSNNTKCILFARLYKAYVSMHAFNKNNKHIFAAHKLDGLLFILYCPSLSLLVFHLLCALRITVHKTFNSVQLKLRIACIHWKMKWFVESLTSLASWKTVSLVQLEWCSKTTAIEQWNVFLSRD